MLTVALLPKILKSRAPAKQRNERNNETAPRSARERPNPRRERHLPQNPHNAMQIHAARCAYGQTAPRTPHPRAPCKAMQNHAKIVATKTTVAGRGRTVDLRSQAAEPWPTELRWIAIQVAPSAVFNKGKTEKSLINHPLVIVLIS